MGQYTVLQANLPGMVSENIGVLLVDDAGAAHVRFRRDLHELAADDDDAEYLELIETDLRDKASELGGKSLLRWMEDSLSNVLRISDPEETAVAWPEADIRRLYKAHVTPKVLPFRTHLPVFTLAAAAGSWGEQMEVTEEDWAEVTADLRLTEDMFVAHVVGRSMEPKIPAGSLCVFRRSVTGSRQGRLVLVENYGETGENRYTIKRYTSVKRQSSEDDWEHETIRLEPLNPEYEAWELSPSDIRVVGEFVRVLD
ncbi:MAG TPA: S24 family peptidase [Bryobacteraceae bacterium]|nr:S24 family peptidase [Bryobacteraceae bacterium]